MSDKKTDSRTRPRSLSGGLVFPSRRLLHLGTVSMKVCLPELQGVGKATWLAPFRLNRLGPQEASGEGGEGARSYRLQIEAVKVLEAL